MKHLRFAVQQLMIALEEAQTSQTQYQSMWRSLGVLSGAFFVILLY